MGEKAGDEAPFPLTDVDKWVLSQTDEEFKYHDWDELRQILSEFARDCLLQNFLIYHADHLCQMPITSQF